MSTIASQYNIPVYKLLELNGINRTSPLTEGEDLIYDDRWWDNLTTKEVPNGLLYWPNYNRSLLEEGKPGRDYLQYGYDNLKHYGNLISFDDLVKNGKGDVKDPEDLKRRVLLALDYTNLTRELKASIYGNIAHETMGFKRLKQLNGGPGVGLFMLEKGNDASRAYNNFVTVNGFGSGDYVLDQVNNIVYEMNRTLNINDPNHRRVSTAATRNKRQGYTDDAAFRDWNSNDINNTTKSFMELYERPNPKYSHLDKRINYALEYLDLYKRGGSIKINPARKGEFTSYCKGNVTKECIKKGKNSTSVRVRKQAVFADNANKWKHKEGGIIKMFNGGSNLGGLNYFSHAYYEPEKNTYDPLEYYSNDDSSVSTNPESTTPTSTKTPDVSWSDLYESLGFNSPTSVSSDSTSSTSSTGGSKSGIGVNNPLNIRYSDANWEGKDKDHKGPFEKFTEMKYGVRAAVINLYNACFKKGKNTPASIIGTWSPKGDPENTDQEVENYINYVAKRLGIGRDDVIDFNDDTQMRTLLAAMAYFENGRDINEQYIIDGLALARQRL